VLRGERLTYTQNTGDGFTNGSEDFIPTAGADFSDLPTDVASRRGYCRDYPAIALQRINPSNKLQIQVAFKLRGVLETTATSRISQPSPISKPSIFNFIPKVGKQTTSALLTIYFRRQNGEVRDTVP